MWRQPGKHSLSWQDKLLPKGQMANRTVTHPRSFTRSVLTRQQNSKDAAAFRARISLQQWNDWAQRRE
jgi:hypothetical protein